MVPTLNIASKNRILLIVIGILIGVGATTVTVISFGLLSQGTSSNSVTGTSQILDSGTESTVGSATTRDSRRNYSGTWDDRARALPTFSWRKAIYDSLDGEDESSILKLIDQARQIAQFSRRTNTLRIAFSRYAEFSPVRALDRAQKLTSFERTTMVETIFEQWSNSNLDEAVAQARELRGTTRRAALRGILVSRDDLPAETRREIAKNLGDENYGIQLISESEIASQISNPAKAWNTVVSDSFPDSTQQELLTRIAETWVEQDGIDILRPILESQPGRVSLTEILEPVLRGATEAEPEKTFAFTQTLEGDQRLYTAYAVISTWSARDPEAAYNAVAKLESTTEKRDLNETIIRNWASRDPKTVLSRIDSLPRPIQATASENAILAIARSDVQEAIQYIVGMENGESRSRSIHSLVWQWSYIDPEATLDWVLTDPMVESWREGLLGNVLRELSGKDPDRALRVAQQHSSESSQYQLEIDVIDGILRRDQDKAEEMLANVSERNQLRTYMSVGGTFIWEDQTDRAMTLGRRLSEPDRTTYYLSMVDQWAFSNPLTLYGKMNELPSAEVKSKAALTLSTTMQRRDNALSDVELERLKAFLNESDAEELATFHKHQSAN